MIDPILRDKFIAALKEKGRYKLRECSICEAPLYYFVENGHLFFNSNCDCIAIWSEPKFSEWSELDFYLEPDHGHIENITKFVES